MNGHQTRSTGIFFLNGAAGQDYRNVFFLLFTIANQRAVLFLLEAKVNWIGVEKY